MACRRLDWLPLAWLALALLIVPFRWLGAMALAACVHELGHYIALRLWGVKIDNIAIDIGGVQMAVGQMNRRQEFFCALAGPVAGLSLLFLVRWLPRTAVCACIHSAYNLLPVYPLDGGRAVRCVCLNERVRTGIEWACLAVIAVAGIYGSVVLRLGLLPSAAAFLTIRRALKGKGLANPDGFRYNRGRIYE